MWPEFKLKLSLLYSEVGKRFKYPITAKISQSLIDEKKWWGLSLFNLRHLSFFSVCYLHKLPNNDNDNDYNNLIITTVIEWYPSLKHYTKADKDGMIRR